MREENVAYTEIEGSSDYKNLQGHPGECLSLFFFYKFMNVLFAQFVFWQGNLEKIVGAQRIETVSL